MHRFLLAVLCAFVSVRGPALHGPRPGLVIRVYQHAVRDPIATTELQQALERLVAGMGFDLAIVDCFTPSCPDVLASHELALRYLPGANPENESVCAMAHPGVREPGVLITIYEECVSGTMRLVRSKAIQGHWHSLFNLTAVDVLTPFVLHEIIHLLLPHEPHGKGVFKAEVGADDWRDFIDGDSKLDRALAARLRTAVLRRCADAK